jgi:TonB-linked SusC/RagA family outer membrane protein
VLKDASATAIYGAQGANGVIIITTKKAASGRTRVSYDGYVGINGYTAYPKARLGQDYIQLRREAYRTNGEWSSPADDPDIFPGTGEYDAVQAGKWVDWMDLLNQNGTQQSHTITLSGGTDKTKALLSAGYFREEGMLRNNVYNRGTMRINVEHRVTDWLKAGTLSQVTYHNVDNRRDPLSAAMSISPLGDAYDDNGNIVLYPTGDPNRISPLTDERSNIAKDNAISISVMTNGYVELSPLKGLTLRSNIGFNLSGNRRGVYNDATSLARANVRTAESSSQTAFARNLNWDNIATYTKELGDHNFTVTGVVSYVQSDYDSAFASGFSQLLASQLFYNLAATDVLGRSIGSPYISWNNLAFAGRLNYSYKGKYLLTLTGRSDGASRLAPGKKWDFFPSAAVAWNITEESFMKNIPVINNLRLRGSYGISGNYGISVYGTQSGLTVYPMGFGDVPAPAYVFNSTIGNPNLGWEKSATTNVGLDVSVLDSRINLTLDVYKTVTSDILLRRTLPFSSGVADVFQNVGETENKGIEFSITSHNVRNSKLNWTSTLTFTKNNEKITKLINDKNIISTQNPEELSFLLGYPINSFYTYEKLGIWQTDKADLAARYKFGSTSFQPGDIMLADLNGDSIIDANNDRKHIGSRVPDFIASLQNTITWKNFDLSFLLLMRYGQMIEAEFLGRYNPSGEGNGPAIIDYWTPENPTNDFPRPRKGASLSNIFGYQTLTYIDGSFFKIRNVSLGYTLPSKLSKKFYVEKLRVYATGSNLFVKARSHLIKNYDPERGGAESGPLTRQFVFGVNVNF